MLVNPQHMRARPGRKTDVADSVWLADLLRHGLLRPSFIPPAPIRRLRELTRYRATLVQERTQEINRRAEGAGECDHHGGRRGNHHHGSQWPADAARVG